MPEPFPRDRWTSPFDLKTEVYEYDSLPPGIKQYCVNVNA